MKPSSFVVNVARGWLIDEDALYKALLENKLAGAGLDAFAEEPPKFELPVYQLPNVFVQPHTVSGTDGTSRKRAIFALENLNRYASDQKLHAQVNWFTEITMSDKKHIWNSERWDPNQSKTGFNLDDQQIVKIDLLLMWETILGFCSPFLPIPFP